MGSSKTYQRRNARILGLVALLLGLLLAAPTMANEPERFNETVRELFSAGFAGNDEALERGMAYVDETLEADPDHPGALVWQATGWSFQSGMAFARGDWDTGQALFDKSLAQFDRAVSLAPDSLQTRIPRASVLLSVARHTEDAASRNRYLETAVEDYTRILRAAHARVLHRIPSRCTAGAELLGGLAEVLWRLERHDDAKVYLHRMIAELPESRYALMAQRQLDDPHNHLFRLLRVMRRRRTGRTYTQSHSTGEGLKR